MTTSSAVLSDLAQVMLLLRDQPERKEEQRAAFKRFVANLSATDHVLTVTPSAFVWDNVEVPIGRDEVAALHDHFRAHGVGEIRIPVGLMTSTLLSLIRILAAPPGTYGSFDHLTARLDAAGCGVVQVLPPPEEGPKLLDTPVELPPERPPIERRGDTAPRPALNQPEGVDDEGHLSGLGPDALSEAKVGMMHFVTMQTRALGHADDLVHSLAEAKSEEDVTERLNQLIQAGEAAAQKADWKEVLTAAHGLVQLEGKAGDHRGFIIALRRLLPRSVLEHIAHLTSNNTLKPDAIAVLRRMGADGAEVLLYALVNSEDIGERRAYFNAMKEMTEGSELLVHMLSHDQWFVVRNVADLCADLKLENAVPALAKQSTHSDERVRRSIAAALAKIGGGGAVESLRRLLRDPVPGVRMEAVKGLDGRKNRNLAMSLALAADEESKPDVQKEMYLALGRIASNEAIMALRKAAEPGGKLFHRKPTAIRLNAVAGLHAAGPSAANVLKEMLRDDDREVREAVEKALATLWE